MCICLCQNTGAMNRPLRLAECFVVISWVFVALLTIRSQRNGRLLAAVGADLSRPHIYIRYAFAIRLKHIHVMFATCSLSVCYIFAVQKYGFWRAKRGFLHCKSMVFAKQKGGFYFLASALLQCCYILAAFYSVYFSVTITILVFPRCVRFVCLCCQKPVAFVPFVPSQFCLLFVPHGQ